MNYWIIEELETMIARIDDFVGKLLHKKSNELNDIELGQVLALAQVEFELKIVRDFFKRSHAELMTTNSAERGETDA